MGTVADKLRLLADTKANIRQAIQEKGQEVTDADAFSTYPDKIRAISGGGQGTVQGVVFDQVDAENYPVEISLFLPGDAVPRWMFMGGDDSEGIDSAYNRVRKINLPENISVISDGAFYMLQGLKEINLKGIVKTGYQSFGDCIGLEEISLPAVERIGGRCFENCDSLRTVTLGGPGKPVKEIGSNAFYGVGKATTITVYTAEAAEIPPASWAGGATVIFKNAG